MIIKLLAPYG